MTANDGAVQVLDVDANNWPIGSYLFWTAEWHVQDHYASGAS